MEDVFVLFIAGLPLPVAEVDRARSAQVEARVGIAAEPGQAWAASTELGRILYWLVGWHGPGSQAG